MARMAIAPSTRTPTKKGTSLGRRPITSTMNKSDKRRFKKYRGQGK
jgi:hypothetical protein